jgi:hypothetical protein
MPLVSAITDLTDLLARARSSTIRNFMYVTETERLIPYLADLLPSIQQERLATAVTDFCMTGCFPEGYYLPLMTPHTDVDHLTHTVLNLAAVRQRAAFDNRDPIDLACMLYGRREALDTIHKMMKTMKPEEYEI